MIAFVLPSDPFSIKKVDTSYEDEYNLLKEKGFQVYLIDIDQLKTSKIYPNYNNEKLLYRGWMLDRNHYEQLNICFNHNLIVQPHEYLYSHHIINWYEEIKEDTFETHFATQENAKKIFSSLNWKEAFVKDYVKSIKTGKGSIVDSIEDIDRMYADMLKYKGFIEGGIVFRKVEDFDQQSETRFFIINGKVNAPKKVSEDMQQLAEKISHQHNAFFYTVDIIKQNNNYKVIEIGDGQVSDMVGWNIKDFVKIFEPLKENKKNKIK